MERLNLVLEQQGVEQLRHVELAVLYGDFDEVSLHNLVILLTLNLFVGKEVVHVILPFLLIFLLLDQLVILQGYLLQLLLLYPDLGHKVLSLVTVLLM